MNAAGQQAHDGLTLSSHSTDKPERPGRERPFPIGPMIAGFLVILYFGGSLGAWSLLAPLESAVVSPGVVSVASYRKTIQHLEGGIVDQILVSEGDNVERNQLLVQLQNVRPSAEFKQFKAQYMESQAAVARLLAERNGADSIDFSEDLLASAEEDPGVRAVLKDQDNVFQTRRLHFNNRLSVLKQQIAQTKALILGLEGQIAATETQLRLAKEEHEEIKELFAQNLVPKPRLLELQRQVAKLEGVLSEHQASISRERKSILESELQMGELKTSSIAEITEELRAERSRVFELSQQNIAAEDVLRRTQIRSPIEGVVVNLQIHTREGVITAGQPLMEVVPSSDELVVEAFVDPEDIDEVRTGLSAHVQLTSLNRRRRKPIDGTVVDVSADRLTDEQTGKAFYRARIELDANALDQVGNTLLAGMGADVFIRTGARTPLDYLLQPITRILQLSLRET